MVSQASVAPQFGLRRRQLQFNERDTTIYPTMIALVSFFILCKVVTMLRDKYCPRPASEAQASLLQYNFLQHLPGFTRGDVEQQLVHAERWKCDICQFENLVETLHCHLCGTAYDKPSQSPAMKDNAELSSSVALSIEPVALQPLTHRQLCARSRKNWTRTVVNDGMKWHFHCDQSSAFETQGCVIQARASQAQDDELENKSLTLEWLSIDDCDVQNTVVGEKLLLPVWCGLLQVSSLAFSAKYAWFLDQVSTIVLPYEAHHFRFKTRREHVVEEALAHLSQLDGDLGCATTRYEFKGEIAIDAGAVQREWYMLVAQSIMDESLGLFSIADHDTNGYYINPASQTKITEFRAVGRFLAQAILSGQVVPLQFSPVLFKAILGSPMTLLDVECMDPPMYRSLMHVLESEQVEDLALTFSAVERNGDSVVEVELIPNGANVLVTKASAHDYVTRMVRYLLFDRVQHQLAALLHGIYDILPPALLVPFDFKELELLVCGLSVIDVHDWKLNTIISSNLKDSPVYSWFWEVVESLNAVDQAKLLQFCTGSSRVPVQGFKGLTSYDGNICHFSISGKNYTPGMYPVAHACFNRLDLPLYPTKELVQAAIEVLLQAAPTGFTIM
ncbi:hypothetical protein Ae201684P_006328 [Aphanomyces euteiches]|uniref:HECT-type E3 ubiquitin transferase n=1 Tax=Aphanomyces euteiches TaxID=100861 RepID=A0A6G0XBP0_9STRA|nr:hypothetical protein Ae201684_006687 [Aphanomyces euteiches]KAH9090924.1 hypothetical protein Ae201684P_006328 [Aphanomyces euteiches]